MLKLILGVVLTLILSACMQPSIAPEKQTDFKEEIQDLYSSAYPLFLQARLGSLNMDITKEACFKGVKAACNEPSFIYDRSDAELKELCMKGVGNACYQLSERLIGFPIEDTIVVSRIKDADPKAFLYAQKGCELSHAKACALEGILSLNTQLDYAFGRLLLACEKNSILGCQALYASLKNVNFESTEKQNQLLQYAYAKILDFGMDNLLCENSSCLITGELAYTDTMNKECQKGSGLACVSLAYLYKKDNKEAYQTQMAVQTKWLDVLRPHCLKRGYVPACQVAMELYFMQRKGHEWMQAGNMACVSDFYASGMVRYERESQICTRMGDALLGGVYAEGKEILVVPKDKDHALYLYKVGCERGNEGRACSKLERILREDARLVTP